SGWRRGHSQEARGGALHRHLRDRQPRCADEPRMENAGREGPLGERGATVYEEPEPQRLQGALRRILYASFATRTCRGDGKRAGGRECCAHLARRRATELNPTVSVRVQDVEGSIGPGTHATARPLPPCMHVMTSAKNDIAGRLDVK